MILTFFFFICRQVVLCQKRIGKERGALFAMKILSKQHLVKRRQIERTRTERKVLSVVDHPFIMKLHYAFQTDDKLYLVLDYCPGGELFFHLSRFRRFPERVARFYAAELLLAIGHLHKRGIIYRDLKPENVLLDAEGHVKLGDFGLATRNRDVDEGTEEVSRYDAIDDIRPLLGDPALSVSRVSLDVSTGGESMTGGVGTTFYRAPEQEAANVPATARRSDKRYTVQADIFSLGVILFEMFHPPFSTYMERAKTLSILTGDKVVGRNSNTVHDEPSKLHADGDKFKQKAIELVTIQRKSIAQVSLELGVA